MEFDDIEEFVCTQLGLPYEKKPKPAVEEKHEEEGQNEHDGEDDTEEEPVESQPEQTNKTEEPKIDL